MRTRTWAIIAATAAVAAFLMALAHVAHAQDMGWVSWVNPTTNAAQEAVLDPETGDTTWTASCSIRGGPLSDLGSVLVWRYPRELVAVVDVRGREGLRDSVLLERGRLYWFEAVDTTGNKAPCPPSYLLPALNPTGIPVDPSPAGGDVILVHLYAVTGQQVGLFSGYVWDRLWKAHGVMERSLLLRGITQGRLAAGVYFVRGVTSGGRPTAARRVVLVR